MSNPILPGWHPAWLFIPASVWALLIVLAASTWPSNHKPGVRHSLPDPITAVDQVARSN